MFSPPRTTITFDRLSSDADERHEQLVDVFGDFVMSLLQQCRFRISELVASQEARAQLGALFRSEYDAIAKLPEEQRELAIELADAAAASFCRVFLTMISGAGRSNKIGDRHAVRFLLELEVFDPETGKVELSEVINRGGQRILPDYWGRWLNRREPG